MVREPRVARDPDLVNVVQNRKLGSVLPKVAVDGASVTVIRPIIYLNDRTVASVHRHARLLWSDLR